MSEGSEFKESNSSELVIESVPFNPEVSGKLIRLSDERKEYNSSQCSFENSIEKSCENSEGKGDSASRTVDDIAYHTLAIEKEKWRAEAMKYSLKVKEYEILVSKLNEKIRFSEEKSGNASFSSDKSLISISKSELAEINYHRLLLEKEITSLKQVIQDNNTEIQQLKGESVVSDLPFYPEERHRVRNKKPLQVIDKNLPAVTFRKIEADSPKNREQLELQHQLHESLKINDKLNAFNQELQDKIKSKDLEISRISRDSMIYNKRASRNQSVSSINSSFHLPQNNDNEALRLDLEMYVNKCEEFSLQINEQYKELQKQKEISSELNERLVNKKRIINEYKAQIESLSSKLTEAKEEINSLMINRKSVESSIVIKENEKNCRISELNAEVDKYRQEIISLKRNLDLVHNEREETEIKLKGIEDLKHKLAAANNHHETSRSNEIKLLEEISILKSRFNSQESQCNTANSRLAKLQEIYQGLEGDFTVCSKRLVEMENQLFIYHEENSKLRTKLGKSKQKINKIRYETQGSYSDYKEMTRNYMTEKAHVNKLSEQNHELRLLIKTLEDMRDKLIEKVDSLNDIKSDLLCKLKNAEEGYSSLQTEKNKSVKLISDDFDRISSELATVKSELKRKTEDLIITKAESRKLLNELNDFAQKLKKSQDQQEFYQRLSKTNESEITRIADKMNLHITENDEKSLKITGLSSEVLTYKNQINLLTSELKRLENSNRILSLDNYSLKSQLDDLDRIKSAQPNEDSFKEDYYKLLRAYQHLSSDYKLATASLAENRPISTEIISNKTPADDYFASAEIEKIQVKLQGTIEEKESLERKLEFLAKEKSEYQDVIRKYQEEIQIRDQRISRSESCGKEAQKYKSEVYRLEAEQNRLKKELEEALIKLQGAQSRAKRLEEGFGAKKSF